MVFGKIFGALGAGSKSSSESKNLTAQEVQKRINSYISDGDILDEETIANMCSTQSGKMVLIGLHTLLMQGLVADKGMYTIDSPALVIVDGNLTWSQQLFRDYNVKLYPFRRDHNDAIARYKALVTTNWRYIDKATRSALLQNPDLGSWLGVDINAEYVEYSTRHPSPASSTPQTAPEVVHIIEGDRGGGSAGQPKRPPQVIDATPTRPMLPARPPIALSGGRVLIGGKVQSAVAALPSPQDPKTLPKPEPDKKK